MFALADFPQNCSGPLLQDRGSRPLINCLGKLLCKIIRDFVKVTNHDDLLYKAVWRPSTAPISYFIDARPSVYAGPIPTALLLRILFFNINLPLVENIPSV
jgi:hypothetical protein